MQKILPLPSVLNEQSFCRFATKQEFVAAMKSLLAVLARLKEYGFSLQLSCSSAVFDQICYADMTFRSWLRLSDRTDNEEVGIRKFILSAITKVPRLEDGYSSFYETPEFDLFWNDEMIFINQERYLPAFLIGIVFNLPILSLPLAEFKDRVYHNLMLRELEGDCLKERIVVAKSFSTIHQIESEDDSLKHFIENIVVDVSDFLKIRLEMFPDLVFSHEVENAIIRHHVNFRSIPILGVLIRMQQAVRKMSEHGVCFEDAYGRVSTLAMNESATVRQRIPETRCFTWDDGKRFCFPHVKIGNGYRIHFLPDRAAGKVYIGYMGPHLSL